MSDFVERYDLGGWGDNAYMEPYADGEYVLYDDYKLLLARIAELEAQPVLLQLAALIQSLEFPPGSALLYPDQLALIGAAIAEQAKQAVDLEARDRWNPASEPPTEKGEYLCKMMDERNNDIWFEVIEYSPTRKKAFGEGWSVSNFDAVAYWRHIEPPKEQPRASTSTSRT